MFKDLFSGLDALKAGKELADDAPAAKFVDQIQEFAFYTPELFGEQTCKCPEYRKDVLAKTLTDEGLGYGSKPKGLVTFHAYNGSAVEETRDILYTGLLGENTFERAGYTFLGWSPAVADTVTGNATYVAQWQRNSYTVTYMVDGELYKTESYAYGATITAADAPTKEGYAFSGWSVTMSGSTFFTESTFVVNGSAKCTAVFGEA